MTRAVGVGFKVRSYSLTHFPVLSRRTFCSFPTYQNEGPRNALGTPSPFAWQRILMPYNGFLGIGTLWGRQSSTSMETFDATAVAQLAVKLGLVTPSRMEE